MFYIGPHPALLEIHQSLFVGFDELRFISKMDLVLPILRPGETPSKSDSIMSFVVDMCPI